jgi:hypothetical protein
LNLDDAKLYAQYPTPEVSFEGEAPVAACGQTITLEVKTRAPKGTALLFASDDVAVLDEKTTGAGWKAKVKIQPAATPSLVTLHAIAPVSGAEQSISALKIRGRYTLELKFEDGWSARFETENADPGSGVLEGKLAFKKGGESRSLPARVDPGERGLRVRWQRSDEEAAVESETAQKLQSLGGEDAMRRMVARIQECFQKPQPEQAPCMAAVSKQNDADAAELRKKKDAIEAETDARRPTAAWACGELALTADAGALSGSATCAPKNRKLKASGTLTCSALRE